MFKSVVPRVDGKLLVGVDRDQNGANESLNDILSRKPLEEKSVYLTIERNLT